MNPLFLLLGGGALLAVGGRKAAPARKVTATVQSRAMSGVKLPVRTAVVKAPAKAPAKASTPSGSSKTQNAVNCGLGLLGGGGAASCSASAKDAAGYVAGKAKDALGAGLDFLGGLL